MVASKIISRIIVVIENCHKHILNMSTSGFAPFPPISKFKNEIPNQETVDTFEATDRGEGLIEYESFEDFEKDIKD